MVREAYLPSSLVLLGWQLHCEMHARYRKAKASTPHTCAGVESQLGSVQQGDSPLQLQSPVPGVTLPQYQPDPSLPATQPPRTEGSASQHELGASAGGGISAAARKAPFAAAAVNLQQGVSTTYAAEELSKQTLAGREQSSAPEGANDEKDKPNGQSNSEALDKQARAWSFIACSTMHSLMSAWLCGCLMRQFGVQHQRCRCLLEPRITNYSILLVKAAAKEQFEKLVRMEFAKAMAGGALSANEAAVQAVALARARAEHLDLGSFAS